MRSFFLGTLIWWFLNGGGMGEPFSRVSSAGSAAPDADGPCLQIREPGEDLADFAAALDDLGYFEEEFSYYDPEKVAEAFKRFQKDFNRAQTGFKDCEALDWLTPVNLKQRQVRRLLEEKRMRWAKACLADLGYDPGPPDGLSDRFTILAMKRFQVRWGLDPSGILDDPTRNRLAAASPHRKEPQSPAAPKVTADPDRTDRDKAGAGTKPSPAPKKPKPAPSPEESKPAPTRKDVTPEAIPEDDDPAPSPREPNPADNVPVSAIADIITRHHYRHPDASHVAGMTIGELNTFLKTLDPYSEYLTPDRMKKRDLSRGRVGIGAGIHIVGHGDEAICIPLPDGPAYRAGLKSPRYLAGINGAAISIEKMLADGMPRIPPGKPVELLVRDDPAAEPRTVRVLSGAFRKPSAARIIEDGVDLIRIYRFVSGETLTEMSDLFSEPESRGGAIIIDLRYCPGGSLTEAVDMAGIFLSEGTALATLEDSRGVTERFFASAVAAAAGRDLCLLVGRYTASSAEVFAMILQDHARAVLVGERTRGKCLVQRMIDLEGGAGLHLSVSQAFGKSRRTCQGSGLAPDRAVAPKRMLDTRFLVETYRSSH